MSLKFERISVIGAGAMGAVYASKFYDMDKSRISLIAGGRRYARLSGNGLVVNGKHYAIPVFSPEEEVPPSDLILVAVKNHHLPEAIRDMKKAVDEGTHILSVMNGIDSEKQIGAVYGMEKVLYAVAVGIDAVREIGGVTYSRNGKLYFGEAENLVLTERVKALEGLFDRAGIVHETPEDMIRTLWWKFMINVGINQASAVLRAPYGVFHRFREARELMETAMREVIRLAEALKISLSEQDIQEYYSFLSKVSPDGKTSMLQDVEAKRKTEVEIFAGKVMELGKQYAVSTPVNETLYRILRVTEQYLD
jgi:2-dehydropantoate 2-reductase